MYCGNPFAFRPGPVSFWTTVVYIAIAIPLIYIHETVPPAPSDRSLYSGLNLTEAWLDLQVITRKFHPYNSHENDDVRELLIERSKEILDRNGVKYSTDQSPPTLWHEIADKFEGIDSDDISSSDSRPPGVTLFDDQISNVTWTYDTTRRLGANIGKSAWAGQYFEGNNYYIYIHGKDDPPGDWWQSESRYKKFRGKGGVLVNCHFDSVSTGYGATDDGMACVSMLQLLSHFTSNGKQPRNGIVLLFNNAEEDGLLGARAFGYSPLLQFCHTFVNLEGAGAGGRAILFRTTDLKAAKAYGGSPHPFGSVVAANAFERGVIKSGTDFEIWNDVYGQRGMDIAFYEPRARYHTNEDDTRHASVNSIWHMLSAALASTKKLSETTGTEFNGARSDGNNDKVLNGKQTEGVWFDLFGTAWAAFALRGLFAWSLTLLVATPLILVIVTYILVRQDKYYFFAKSIHMHDDLDKDPVTLGGWKGFFRFPFALIFASALTIASTFLLAKFNPLIIYSSGYLVWSMTLSLFYFSFWLIMRGSSFVRPSALHRGFVNIWLFAFGWVVQVFAAVLEDRMGIAALYSAVFLQSAVFLSLLISLLEQFALLGKHEFAMQLHDAHQSRDLPSRTGGAETGDGEGGEPEDDGQVEGVDGEDDARETEAATETTPLRAGESGYGSYNHQPSFANTYRQSVAGTPSKPSIGNYQPYEFEQTWSGRLPTWPWFFQFLLLAPVPLILFGNLGLVAMTALRMTGTDGGSFLVPLLAIGLLSIFLLLPITPFLHRVTHHVPMFLLLVFIGSFIYNLIAFPFSADHRFKFYFQQVVDLDNGTDFVAITGLEEYSRQVINALPIAAGQDVKCKPSSRTNLMDCHYDASSLPPDLVDGKKFEDLITFQTLDSNVDGTARFQVQALDTRVCYLQTSRPVYGFTVEGGGSRDPRFGSFPREGLKNIQIWRRNRELPWNVTLALNDDGNSLAKEHHEVDTPDTANDGELKPRSLAESSALIRRADPLEITVSCAWSDANDASKIPAFHEVVQYMPSWSTVTKKNVGLVEVRKTYKIRG
ncbi:Fc.00g074770.m01.CDS01 [Cosmosporella sp. VM-42]